MDMGVGNGLPSSFADVDPDVEAVRRVSPAEALAHLMGQVPHRLPRGRGKAKQVGLMVPGHDKGVALGQGKAILECNGKPVGQRGLAGSDAGAERAG